jgi:hypothetical protein
LLHGSVESELGLEAGDGIGPKPLRRLLRTAPGTSLGLFAFVALDSGVCGRRGVQHGLQDSTSGVDEPVVDLQQGQVRLGCDLPLLVLRRVRVLEICIIFLVCRFSFM